MISFTLSQEVKDLLVPVFGNALSRQEIGDYAEFVYGVVPSDNEEGSGVAPTRWNEDFHVYFYSNGVLASNIAASVRVSDLAEADSILPAVGITREDSTKSFLLKTPYQSPKTLIFAKGGFTYEVDKIFREGKILRAICYCGGCMDPNCCDAQKWTFDPSTGLW